MRQIGVTGATGFLGRHTVARLAAAGYDVRAIRPDDVGGVRVVVHLAYASEHAANIPMARDLVRACIEAGVERMIHCSTAIVVGRAGETVVTEATPCSPRTAYARTKYAIEDIMREGMGERVTIIRPTMVIGEGGRQLVTLVRALAGGSGAVNALRSFVYGHRAMNLVPVEDVAAAIETLVRDDAPAQTLLISSDEDPRNELQAVERLVLDALGRPARRSPVVAPPALLSLLGLFVRREIAPPRRRYITQYPQWRASTRTVDLAVAIQRFARAYVKS